MELYHIETALAGQFVWHKPARKKFHTDIEIERSTDTAILVFIGLADMNGFTEKAICNYLHIAPPAYKRLLTTYYMKMREAADKISRDVWNYNRQDLAQRVWIKSAFVGRNIKFQHGVITISEYQFM